MGEIGFPRKEFLYELTWWEVRSIIRGYNARHHEGWRQARLIAYHVRYCMGVRHGEVAKEITKWLPFSWEQEPVHVITEEEADELAEELEAYRMSGLEEEAGD